MGVDRQAAIAAKRWNVIAGNCRDDAVGDAVHDFVVVIDNVESALRIDGDAGREPERRLRGDLSFEGVSVRAGTGHGCDRSSWVDSADAPVVGVGDVDVPARIDGQRIGRDPSLSCGAVVSGEGGGAIPGYRRDAARGIDFSYSVIVDDVQIGVRVTGDVSWEDELRLGCRTPIPRKARHAGPCHRANCPGDAIHFAQPLAFGVGDVEISWCAWRPGADCHATRVHHGICGGPAVAVVASDRRIDHAGRDLRRCRARSARRLDTPEPRRRRSMLALFVSVQGKYGR